MGLIGVSWSWPIVACCANDLAASETIREHRGPLPDQLEAVLITIFHKLVIQQ